MSSSSSSPSAGWWSAGARRNPPWPPRVRSEEQGDGGLHRRLGSKVLQLEHVFIRKMRFRFTIIPYMLHDRVQRQLELPDRESPSQPRWASIAKFDSDVGSWKSRPSAMADKKLHILFSFRILEQYLSLSLLERNTLVM